MSNAGIRAMVYAQGHTISADAIFFLKHGYVDLAVLQEALAHAKAAGRTKINMKDMMAVTGSSLDMTTAGNLASRKAAEVFQARAGRPRTEAAAKRFTPNFNLPMRMIRFKQKDGPYAGQRKAFKGYHQAPSEGFSMVNPYFGLPET